jgi:hypothetical protein
LAAAITAQRSTGLNSGARNARFNASYERTREGDDHPARLFLVFRTPTGEERRMEIIWGNELKAGD